MCDNLLKFQGLSKIYFNTEISGMLIKVVNIRVLFVGTFHHQRNLITPLEYSSNSKKHWCNVK